jgi:hypothetical protein
MKNHIKTFFPSLTISSPLFHLPLSSLFLTSLTVLTVLSANAQVPSYVPTNGLVGYWPFNGNANDESGNGNNGTVNGATLAADRFGIADKAYSFNGVDNNIEIADSPELNFGVNPTFSISMWYTVNSLQPMGLLTKAQTSFLDPNVNGWNWKGFNFYLESGVGYIQHSAPCNGNISYSIESLPQHLVMTIENSTVKIFMNSVEILQFSCGNLTTETVSNNMPLFFGIDRDQFSHLNGTLDDIGIWNRALTADEVLALYNGCNVTPLAVSGNITPTQFTQETYTYPNTVGSTYNWTVTNGVIVSGQGTNSIDVMWANTGIGSVSVVETNATTCTGDEVTYDVVVIPTNVEEFANTMILYPNPVTTELNLQITSDLIGSDLFVFDALGKQILKQQILSTNTTINTSSFAVGNYVVKVGGGVKKFEVVR